MNLTWRLLSLWVFEWALHWAMLFSLGYCMQSMPNINHDDLMNWSYMLCEPGLDICGWAIPGVHVRACDTLACWSTRLMKLVGKNDTCTACALLVYANSKIEMIFASASHLTLSLWGTFLPLAAIWARRLWHRCYGGMGLSGCFGWRWWHVFICWPYHGRAQSIK